MTRARRKPAGTMSTGALATRGMDSRLYRTAPTDPARGTSASGGSVGGRSSACTAGARGVGTCSCTSGSQPGFVITSGSSKSSKSSMSSSSTVLPSAVSVTVVPRAPPKRRRPCAWTAEAGITPTESAAAAARPAAHTAAGDAASVANRVSSGGGWVASAHSLQAGVTRVTTSAEVELAGPAERRMADLSRRYAL